MKPSEKFIKLVELTGAENDLTQEQLDAMDRGEYDIDTTAIDRALEEAIVSNMDNSVSAGLDGRAMVKNFSDESDPGAVDYLKERNPNAEIVQVGGKIYARQNPELPWEPLDSPELEFADIGDAAWDLGSGAASAIAGIVAGLPTAGVGGMAAGAGTAVGLNGIKQMIGKASGARKEWNGVEPVVEGAASALIPGAGQLAGKYVAKPASKAFNAIAERVSKYPASALNRFLTRGYDDQLDEAGRGGQEVLEGLYDKYIEPIWQVQDGNKTKAGDAISGVMDALEATGAKVPWRTTPGENPFYIKDTMMPRDHLESVLSGVKRGTPDQDATYATVKPQLRGVFPHKSSMTVHGKSGERWLSPRQLWEAEQMARTKARKFQGTPDSLSTKDMWTKESVPALNEVAENSQRLRTRLAKDFLDQDITPLNDTYKKTLRSESNLQRMFGDKTFKRDNTVGALKKLGGLHNDVIERSYVDGVPGVDQAKNLEGMDFIRNLMDQGALGPADKKGFTANVAKSASKFSGKMATEVSNRHGREAATRHALRQYLGASSGSGDEEAQMAEWIRKLRGE